MIVTRGHPGIEMTADRVFGHRIRRLAVITAIGLGTLGGFAYLDGAPWWAVGLIGFGALAMPFTLACSLRRPGARRALTVPAVIVLAGMAGIVTGAPEETTTGWIGVLSGLTVGTFLGSWFWFRWLPVPWLFDDPFGWPRVALLGVHIGLVLAGGALIVAGL